MENQYVNAAFFIIFLIATVIAIHALFVLLFRPGRRKAAALRLVGSVLGAPVVMVTLLAVTTGLPEMTPERRAQIEAERERRAQEEAERAEAEALFPTRQEVRMIRDALELHYIRNKIYYPVRCKTEQTQGHHVFFCTLATGAGQIGGVYIGQSGPEVFTVNGKAIQHVRKLRDGVIRTSDGQAVPVSRWSGDRIDIPAAIETFQ